MQKVQLDNNFISLNEIQKCIDAFERILYGQESQKSIVLNANKRIEGVDPLLISYFILFKKQISDLKIILYLPYNPIEQQNEQLEYQLKQFGTFAYLTTGMDVFQITFGSESNKSTIGFDLKKHNTFPDRWFVFSTDYFPILFINENLKLFDFFFSESFSSLSESFSTNVGKLDKRIRWDKNSEQLKKNYHSFIKEISNPKKRNKSILGLAEMAFINSLDEAKIAHFYFEEEYKISDYTSKNKIQAGNLVNKIALEYYNTIKPIFEELRNSSISHQFFFSTILATEILKDKEAGKDVLNDATKTAFIIKINNLWGFTKDLVAGVKELAKNVREHSNPSFGAISVRLFGINKWIKTKIINYTENNIYNKYKEHLFKNGFNNESSIIEINVIDVGISGVIPTLIQNTESVFTKVANKNFDIENLFREDIENLKSKRIGFLNLLDTSKQQLNQQSKRSIAHFGLLTLSKLVTNNLGLILASSQNNNHINNRESICIPNFLPYSHPIEKGTNYNIILPINSAQSYTTHLPHKINLPYETSAKDVKGIEELFQYELVNLTEQKDNLELNSLSKYLFEICLENTVLDNRENENLLWNKIENEISFIKNNVGAKFAICINFLNLPINESQLFRLLGNCELNFPSIPIIILNIQNECYQRLIKINGEFHSLNPNLAYWNENISTLIYSYQEIRNDHFNFSDVLWGKTRKDFAYINWLVSFSTFNSTSMLHKDSIKKSLSDENQKINPNTDMFFLNNNILLPFELILRGLDNSTTLFEENAIVLLKNELKSQII